MNEGLEQHNSDSLQIQINTKLDYLSKSIQEANMTLPKREQQPKQKWITSEILDHMCERKKAKNTPQYEEINQKVRVLCKQAKRNWLESNCNKIEELGKKHKSRDMHSEIRNMTKMNKGGKDGGCIKNKQGKILFDLPDIKQRWVEYVGELFQDNRGTKPEPQNNEGPPILRSEVERAIKTTGKGKAAGPDGITVEMIEALEEFGIDKLTDLFNDIYFSGCIPEEMRLSEFITLPKKPNAVECTDYRTISLMSHITKILLKILLERNKTKINKEISEEQFGFRPQNGTREAIFCMRLMIEKYLEVKKNVYVCFIDYTKAFDTVNHEKLIKCLKEINLDGTDIQLITNLYWDQTANIRCNGETTDQIPIQRGVRQGCVLSPSLFNIYTESIFNNNTDENEEVTEDAQITEENVKPGLKIGGRRISNLRYADDTALMAESPKLLQELVDLVNKKSKELGLEMNIKKTKVMAFSRDNTRPRIDIFINGERLEQVSSYTYLGHLMTEDGTSEKEIRKRIGIAKSTFKNMKNVFTSKQISKALKMRLVKNYVYSTFQYGAETWTLNKSLERKIEAFEMWTLRQLGQVHWSEKKSNAEVLKMLKVKRELLKDITTKQLKYFGHIKRHNSILKEILEGKVEGTRGRGRPRFKWDNNIKRWTGLTMTEASIRAKDRCWWRSTTVNLRLR
jgi:hypothetical protein